MGRKNVILPHKLVDQEGLDTNFTSPIVNIQYQDNVGVQIVTNGVTDNTGQFSIQATINSEDWETLTLSPVIDPLANANTKILVNLNQLPFVAIRVVFEAAGGTPDGTCDVYVSSKEV